MVLSLEDIKREQKKSEEIRNQRLEMLVDLDKKISEILDSFNNITEETTQLIEIKDIINELRNDPRGSRRTEQGYQRLRSWDSTQCPSKKIIEPFMRKSKY